MILQPDMFEDIPAGSGQMRIHCLRPEGDTPRPGIVLFSEIYQVTAPIRRLGAFLAGQGYVVAIPEVYHEYEPCGTVLAYDQAGTERGNALKYTKTLEQYDTTSRLTLDWLQGHPGCTGQLATLGVCLGGHLALRAALDKRVKAMVSFYGTDIHSATLGRGRSDDTLSRLEEVKAACLFIWGRQDPHIPPEGRALIWQRLEAAGICHEWHEFNAQHAFLRDEGHRYDPELFALCMQLATGFLRRKL